MDATDSRRPAAPGDLPPARLTAIVPLKHYHPPYLAQCLRSLLEQPCPRWRGVIVVEAADRAHFATALGDALRDPRLRLVTNAGRALAGAINSGMRAADTEFVALLLGDDLWAPDAVEVLDRAIATWSDVDFFHTARRVIDDDGAPISSVHPSREGFTVADFARGSPVKHLLCWRRRTGLAVGGVDENLNSVGPDDWDFPWVMAEHGARFRALPECLYWYRDHRAGFRLTTHLPLSVHLRECDRILRKHHVDRAARQAFLAAARASYLRQCLYRNRLERWLKHRGGDDPRRGWRDTYR